MKLEMTYHAVKRYIKRVEPEITYEEALRKLRQCSERAFKLRENTNKGHMQYEFPGLNCIGIVKYDKFRKSGIVVTILDKVHHDSDDMIDDFDHELMDEYIDDLTEKFEQLRALANIVEKFYAKNAKKPWDGLIEPKFESLTKLQLSLARMLAAIGDHLPDPGPDGETVPVNVRKRKVRLIEVMAGALYLHKDKDPAIPFILEDVLKEFEISRDELPAAARKYISSRPDSAIRFAALRAVETPTRVNFQKLAKCLIHQLGSKGRVRAMLLVDEDELDAWLETGDAPVETIREVAVKALNEMTDVIGVES